MKRATFLILAGMLSAGGALAQSQSQSGTQAGASAGSSTSAEASRSGGVQAGNNSSAAATATAQHNGTQAGSSGAGSTSASASKSGVQASNSAVNSTSAKNSHGSASSATSSTMNATLVHPVDAKKNRPGDPVTARTTRPSKSPDGTTLPKGTQLVGHVTQAQARSKDQSESDLGIAFDKAVLKNGQEVPMNATILAMAAAQNTASAAAGADDLGVSGGSMAGGGGMMGGSSRGGVVGGTGAVGGATSVVGGATGTVTAPVREVGNVGSSVGSTVGSTANVAGGASRGAVGGLNAAGQLTSNSQGVFNMQGLNLASSASNTTQGSLITSTSRNVHLDGGTQLLLSAASDAQIQASK